jgi:hypothetical protein
MTTPEQRAHLAALRALNEAVYAAHRTARAAGADRSVLAHFCTVSDMLVDEAAQPANEVAR